MKKRRHSFFSDWRNVLPVVLVGAFFLVALAAPWLSPPADPDNPLPFKLVESKDPIPIPPGPGLPYTTSEYDPLGQVSRLVNADGASSAAVNRGLLALAEDANGQLGLSVSDIWGCLKRV